MSAVKTAVPPAPTTKSGDNLWHLVCCDQNLAVCGTDVADHPWTDGSQEPHCAICSDPAVPSPCCGARG